MKPEAKSIGVLIRFSNSETTLPAVLAALKRQTLQPHRLLGVASASTDGSTGVMLAAGAEIVQWTERYDHSRVLNFGLRHLDTDLVLVLSSHTVLESDDAIERMAACFEDRATACASAKWDDDSYYTDAVTWDELRSKGLRFGSIYSNSMGMIRRCLWEAIPFDESLATSEDYAWSIEQLKRGYICHRLDFRFSHQRGGNNRDREFADIVFTLARAHGLRVAWLGVKGAVKEWLSGQCTTATRERLSAWWQSKRHALRRPA